MEAELGKLETNLSGVAGMERIPNAVFVTDLKVEEIAVREASRLNIPTIGLVDTNCDPEQVDYVIPGNDDAIRSAALLTKVVASAVAEGLQARAGVGKGDGEAEAEGAEPLAEWEQELLAGATASTETAGADTPTETTTESS